MSELGILRVDGLQYFRGYGYYEEESNLLTQFVTHVAVRVNHNPSEVSLESVVNYEEIIKQVDAVFDEEWKFIESIVAAIYNRLIQLNGVIQAWVKVEKTKPATLSCTQTSYELGSI